MSPEKELANSSSWKVVEADIAHYPDEQWREWKALAHEFLSQCFRLGLDRYFRAGQSMHHLYSRPSIVMVCATNRASQLSFTPRARVARYIWLQQPVLLARGAGVYPPV